MMFYKLYEVLYAALLLAISLFTFVWVLAVMIRSVSADPQWYGGQFVGPVMLISTGLVLALSVALAVRVMLKRHYIKGAWMQARRNAKRVSDGQGQDVFTQLDGVRVEVIKTDPKRDEFRIAAYEVGADVPYCYLLQRRGLKSQDDRTVTLARVRGLYSALRGHAMSLA